MLIKALFTDRNFSLVELALFRTRRESKPQYNGTIESTLHSWSLFEAFHISWSSDLPGKSRIIAFGRYRASQWLLKFGLSHSSIQYKSYYRYKPSPMAAVNVNQCRALGFLFQAVSAGVSTTVDESICHTTKPEGNLKKWASLGSRQTSRNFCFSRVDSVVSTMKAPR